VTDYAQKALGDVVYVELPKVGATVEKGGQAGVVESVKSASEIYSPVSGEIVEVNGALANDPAIVNSDPEGAAWFYKIKLATRAELAALKDADGYAALYPRTLIKGFRSHEKDARGTGTKRRFHRPPYRPGR
jgi:glycine cleavage system H protein